MIKDIRPIDCLDCGGLYTSASSHARTCRARIPATDTELIESLRADVAMLNECVTGLRAERDALKDLWHKTRLAVGEAYGQMDRFDADPVAFIHSSHRDLNDEFESRLRTESDLGAAYEMVILLMQMTAWGAATGALYEDPVVKKAREHTGK